MNRTFAGWLYKMYWSWKSHLENQGLVLSERTSISTLQPAAQLNNTASSATAFMACHTSQGRKGAGQVKAIEVRVSPWYFYWAQQMASLSLRIVLVAILLWLSGLTIVACNCGGQKTLAAPGQCLPSHQMFNAVKIYSFYEMLVGIYSSQ